MPGQKEGENCGILSNKGLPAYWEALGMAFWGCGHLRVGDMSGLLGVYLSRCFEFRPLILA